MNQTSNQKLNDKAWARWSALFVVVYHDGRLLRKRHHGSAQEHARRRTALDKR